MDVRLGYASQAYAAGRQHAAPSRATQGGGNEALAEAARDFAQTLQRGEETARAAMTGGADPQALVEALAQTELAVETAVTVRDKVVEAYQEILRMPV
ncbi:MAG: flagellar hook-basal body complex protein FliE [Alphaproteobacteria bacterium]|nr:MAG: flagellar hook-basal body complex protein FliE [Alphaproteobacteria bacterium]